MNFSNQDNPADSDRGNISCPDCGAAIPFSISVLIEGGAIECQCGVKISIDLAQSASGLEALEQAQTTINNLSFTEKVDNPPE